MKDKRQICLTIGQIQAFISFYWKRSVTKVFKITLCQNNKIGSVLSMDAHLPVDFVGHTHAPSLARVQ